MKCSFKKLKGQRTMIKLYHGDFLEKAKNIPDDSVDLVLTDPPYGTVKSLRLNKYNKNANPEGAYGWDDAIEPKVLFAEINRILRKNGKAVLFGQEPFTSRMITETIPNLPFSYRMIWEKDHFANGLGSKKAPVNYYEDVMVFSKNDSLLAVHPLRKVMQGYVDKYGKNYIIGLFEKEGRYTSPQSARVHASYKFGFNNGVRFDLMDESLYKFMSDYIDFTKSYEELKEIDRQHKEQYASVFNIWEEEPIESFEDIMVFNKQHSENCGHPLKEYFEKVLSYTELTLSGVNKALGHRRAEHSFYLNKTQFALSTEEVYNELIDVLHIDKMDGFKPYAELKAIDEEYKKEVASTFNLWQKKKSKSNILKYAKDYPSLHPTQKPILLLEDLVKTFSNEGDLVVDLTMGSGSTGVACKNTGRKFIGIEMDDEYFKVAKERIETHKQQLELV